MPDKQGKNRPGRATVKQWSNSGQRVRRGRALSLGVGRSERPRARRSAECRCVGPCGAPNAAQRAPRARRWPRLGGARPGQTVTKWHTLGRGARPGRFALHPSANSSANGPAGVPENPTGAPGWGVLCCNCSARRCTAAARRSRWALAYRGYADGYANGPACVPAFPNLPGALGVLCCACCASWLPRPRALAGHKLGMPNFYGVRAGVALAGRGLATANFHGVRVGGQLGGGAGCCVDLARRATDRAPTRPASRRQRQVVTG